MPNGERPSSETQAEKGNGESIRQSLLDAIEVAIARGPSVTANLAVVVDQCKRKLCEYMK